MLKLSILYEQKIYGCIYIPDAENIRIGEELLKYHKMTLNRYCIINVGSIDFLDDC